MLLALTLFLVISKDPLTAVIITPSRHLQLLNLAPPPNGPMHYAIGQSVTFITRSTDVSCRCTHYRVVETTEVVVCKRIYKNINI
jgi:hypothetical protein